MPTYKHKKYEASEFVSTKFDSAERKAKFANHFVKFAEASFPRIFFCSWFYTTLSGMFGHIAHYDINGFYDVWFLTPTHQLKFLQRTKEHDVVGDPEFTHSDVEMVLSLWVTQTSHLRKLQKLINEDTETRERSELARLKAKYEGT